MDDNKTQGATTPNASGNEGNGGKSFTQEDLDNLAGKVRSEEKAKREAELKAREDEITLRERKIAAQEALRDKNVPTELADFVIDLDEKKTNDNIEKLAKAYAKSVENGVADKLKGNPPKDFSQKDNKSEDTKTISSAF